MSKKFRILFISIIMFGLFGCTQLSPSNNLGSIQIDISGLPVNTAADIMLSGPGYNKKVTSSSLINGLKPNEYIVTARSFSTNSLKYEAAISQTSVDLEAGKIATVKVQYSSKQLHQVSILVTGPGRVKSDDNKISCTSAGTRCSYSYNEGTEIILTAEANSGAKFDAWNADEENTVSSFKLVVDSAQTVEANFIKIAKPDITDPSPSSIKIVSKLNQTSLTSFSFENKGIDTLIYSIEEDVDWLESKTLNGRLATDKKQTINLEVKCSDKAEILTTNVEIKSNDPDEELKTVAINLECKAEPANYELKIALTGLGKVTSADGNIDCQVEKTEKCSFSYQENTTVKLTASPAPDTSYKFESWAGASTETTEELDIVINADKNLTAKFAENFGPPKISKISPESIKISAEVNKSGQESFSFSNIGGGELSYTITDNFDWLAINPTEGSLKSARKQIFTVTATCPSTAGIYSDNIKITSNDPDYSNKLVNVNLNCTNIPEAKERLTINVIGPGTITSTDGNIDCNASGGDCSYNYTVDSNIELTAIADEEASFTAWGQDASGNEAPLIVKMDAAKNISAAFISESAPTLSVSVEGAGTITSTDGYINCSASSTQCSHQYIAGDSVSLSASPDLNYDFDSWSGDTEQTTSTITFEINEDKALEAKFIASSKRLLTVTVNGPGTVTSADGNINCSASEDQCSYKYELETTVSLTSTPDANSSFQSWSGACTGTEACEINITDNFDLTAEFLSSNQYNIDFVLLGSATDASRKTVFETAATNWSKIIVDKLSSETVDLAANEACGYGEPAIQQTVDGLLIVAAIVAIDGEGGILGQAGPRFIRNSSGLPIIGCMQFDSADIANMESNGSFSGVIMHEMGHVIGIGTLWNHKNLLNDYQPTDACSNSEATFTTKPSFTGAKAITEYASLGGTGNIPVEDEYGPGTRCGHWDEATFNNELMTGFVAAGNMPLSRMTAASLEDMGYGIDISAADSYTMPSIQSTSINQFELKEKLIYPEFTIGAFGEILKLK